MLGLTLHRSFATLPLMDITTPPEAGSAFESEHLSANTTATSSIATPSTGITSSVESYSSLLHSDDSSKLAGSESIQCSKHNFETHYEELGHGSFGTVYKVKCRDCNVVSCKQYLKT
jgi:hypothetical protein